MSQKHKTLLVVVGVAVIVGLLMWNSDRNGSPSSSQSPSPSNSTGASSTPATGTVGGVKAQYDALVKEYEGRRIQFDINCQAIPNALTFKNGTKVMFDNRSGDKRTFSLNGKVYNIPGYGWYLLTLSSSKLPLTYTIDCGSAQNVGTITIQK